MINLLKKNPIAANFVMALLYNYLAGQQHLYGFFFVCLLVSFKSALKGSAVND